MIGHRAMLSSAEYFNTPQRRDGESMKDYAERLAVYDANYTRPILIEPSVPKVKPRYRAKAWRTVQQPES